MKIAEVVTPTKRVLNVQPSSLQSQARINKVVQQIAASDQQQPPTTSEKIVAQMQYANLKQQSDAAYAAQLKSQLVNLQARQPKAKVGGREKR